MFSNCLGSISFSLLSSFFSRNSSIKSCFSLFSFLALNSSSFSGFYERRTLSFRYCSIFL